MKNRQPPHAGVTTKVAAWAVHALTASGAVFGFLALLATMEGDIPTVFLWLGLAFLIDGVDGELARHARVTTVTPRFDGNILDHVIDYVTYVAVPALMIHRFGLVPDGWETPAAAAIMAVSCYTFANTAAKTADSYFSGFPALWNLLVLYIYILQPDPWINLAAIAVCGVLTFVPLKFVHPVRVRQWRWVSVGIMLLWALASVRLVLAEPVAISARSAAPVIFWIWVAASAYFVGLSLWRSIAGKTTEA